ncbi:MAG: hypothetical protein ACI898_000854 [Flavobacteriales bacterium]|jgi:hypothetical protein
MTIKGRLTFDGSVEVDETVVGGVEAGALGRSNGKKKSDGRSADRLSRG